MSTPPITANFVECQFMIISSLGFQIYEMNSGSVAFDSATFDDNGVAKVLFDFHDCLLQKATYQPQSIQMTEINGKPRE